MKLNLLTEQSPFSHTFSRAFRVGGTLSQPGENFLKPPKIDEDDAARVLFSSQGELKIDGKGEELPIERAGPQRDREAPSVLATGLKRLAGITKDIQTIQENIEKGVYGSEEQSTAAREELSKLREEFDRVLESENFQSAIRAVQKVRSELSGLGEDELFGKVQGNLPLIGSAVQEAGDTKDASTIQKLLVNLDRLQQGVSEQATVKSLQQLRESIDQAASIDNGGKPLREDAGQFELLLVDLQENVRKLRFLREGVEQGFFSDEQLERVQAEERELQARYRELLQSDGFSSVIGALQNVSELRSGKGGAPAAAAYAQESRGLLGGVLPQLVSEYRFGDLDSLNKSLLGIGEAAGSLETLTSDELGRLSDTVSEALSIVNGDALQDETSQRLKRSIDLNESVFEQYQRKYKSDLVDEIDDFFDIITEDARGAYVLLKEKYIEKGNLLDTIG